jgi:hypothetical protein
MTVVSAKGGEGTGIQNLRTFLDRQLPQYDNKSTIYRLPSLSPEFPIEHRPCSKFLSKSSADRQEN